MLPAGLIQLAFDPVLELEGFAIRWQTIGLSVALILAIGLAALLVSRTPATAYGGLAAGRLGLDELGYVVLAIVPGAVLGGRVVHGLAYWA